MRYDGNICDGCKQPLQENDDIVVCPECATPQHRECYDEKGQCVNAHLHAEGFEWKGKIKTKRSILSSTLSNKDKEGDDIICPNCKQPNPPGSTGCKNCLMKFTMFGVNVVEQAQKQERKEAESSDVQPESPQVQENDILKYEAPFKIGEGDGFETAEGTPADAESADRPEGTNPWNLGGYEDYEEINTFKGPFPVEDYTAGVRTNTLGAFIRSNAQSYINKFKWSEIKGRNGFNWAAFLFAPYWFFYRKLYKPGIIFITLQTIMSIVVTPILEPFTDFYEYMLTLNVETMTEDMLYELTEQMMLIMQDIALPLTLMGALLIIMHLVSGIVANGMYKKYCVKNIKQGLAQASVQEKITAFAKNGGASFLFVAMAYLGEMLLSTLVSYLMF